MNKLQPFEVRISLRLMSDEVIKAKRYAAQDPTIENFSHYIRIALNRENRRREQTGEQGA